MTPAAPARPVAAPVVAIIGRPNVGKSRLFNRLIGRRVAVVEEEPGVTRDRQYGSCTYRGRRFTVVDTGGFESGPDTASTAAAGVSARVAAQSRQAIAEADVVILLFDGMEGLTPTDEALVAWLSRSPARPGGGPAAFYAVNKLDRPPDNPAVQARLAEFHRLGVSPLYPVSAEHGYGVDDLLEALLPVLPPSPRAREGRGEGARSGPRIAVIGRPNVGKSTLINTLLGEARLVTDERPGTTRDPVDTFITYQGQPYCVVDTAGVRRRGRIERGAEQYSVARAQQAVEKADAVFLLLDGVEGVTAQDTKLAGWVLDAGKGLVLLVNKWDLIAADPGRKAALLSEIGRRLPFLPASPVLFVSALTGQGLPQALGAMAAVAASHGRRTTHERVADARQRIMAGWSGPGRLLGLDQAATKPPTFIVRTDRPTAITPAVRRFIERRLREACGLAGVPVRLLVRSAPSSSRRPARRQAQGPTRRAR